jgi:hypothetical protein
MLWVLFILTTLVAVGNFVDFLIGERGQMQIKDRLVTFYVSVAEGDWSVLRIVTENYQRYIEQVFGSRIISIHFILRIFVYSIFTTTMVYAAVALYYFQRNPIVTLGRFFGYAQIAVVHSILDIVTFIILYSTFRHMRSSALGSALVLALGVIFVYALLTIVTAASIAIQVVSYSKTGTNLGHWPAFWISIRHPWASWHAPQFSAISAMGFSVGLPIMIYLTVLFGAFIMYIGRPISQKPLALFLERLEGSKSGVFTITASAAALIVAALASLQKAIG